MIIEKLIKKIKMLEESRNASDYDEDSDLCWKCIQEDFLRNMIRKEGRIRLCSYCGNRGKAFTFASISDLIESVFEDHFERTSTEPSDWEYHLIKYSDTYDWDRSGTPLAELITEIAGVDDEIADAIARILADRHSDFELGAMGEESEFANDSHYTYKTIDHYTEFHEEWRAFDRHIKNESRFLSKFAQSVLNRVFEGIDSFRTEDAESVIQKIGPNTATLGLFRARVFQNPDALFKGLERPDLEIGSPPIGLAAAGRMNAHGISVFYGALSPETALAEVRPPVGSDVVMAKFIILKTLRVLNLSALSKILIKRSYFDPEYRTLLERAAFLARLSSLMTQPVMPDRERFDYLVTQVVAEYLASEHRLDGIIYPSVQVARNLPPVDRTNIVLFHRASRVEELAIPKGTEIRVSQHWLDEEGSDTEISVTETVPKLDTNESPGDSDPFSTIWGTTHLSDLYADLESFDPREPSLRISLEDIKVRNVTAVEFTSGETSVNRRRQEKQPWMDDEPF